MSVFGFSGAGRWISPEEFLRIRLYLAPDANIRHSRLVYPPPGRFASLFPFDLIIQTILPPLIDTLRKY